jgi:XTP/dITP diphosphohydrolase
MKFNELIIGTSNQGKIEEIKYGLEGLDTQLLELDSDIHIPEETGLTFLSNAEQKAAYYSNCYETPVLSEDSGIIVDCLKGWLEEEEICLPGLFSARFCELDLSYNQTGKLLVKLPNGNSSLWAKDRDELNNRRLLNIIYHWPFEYRHSTYISAIAIASKGKILWSSEERCFGRIGNYIHEGNGFGHDSIFTFSPGIFSKFFSQLSLEEKMKISHRGKVLANLKKWLEEE